MSEEGKLTRNRSFLPNTSDLKVIRWFDLPSSLTLTIGNRVMSNLLLTFSKPKKAFRGVFQP